MRKKFSVILSTSVKEFIIGLGFLNGVWFSVGIDPKELVMKFLAKYGMTLPTVLQWLFVIIPVILMIVTLLTLIKVYKKGGILGSLAVLVAFISGTILIINWFIAVLFLCIAILIGMIGFRKSRKR